MAHQCAGAVGAAANRGLLPDHGHAVGLRVNVARAAAAELGAGVAAGVPAVDVKGAAGAVTAGLAPEEEAQRAAFNCGVVIGVAHVVGACGHVDLGEAVGASGVQGVVAGIEACPVHPDHVVAFGHWVQVVEVAAAHAAAGRVGVGQGQVASGAVGAPLVNAGDHAIGVFALHVHAPVAHLPVGGVCHGAGACQADFGVGQCVAQPIAFGAGAVEQLLAFGCHQLAARAHAQDRGVGQR